MAYEREKLYAAFERHDEFVAIQHSLVQLDVFVEPSQELDNKEALSLQKLNAIFNDYREQAYLLDPYLESLLSPVIDKIKNFAHDYCSASERTPSRGRVERLSWLLYGYIKFRGYKTITRFFPHEIVDMPTALNFMLIGTSFVQYPSQWALRYTMMLWLSLVSMLPFDLAQFDDEAKLGHTAKSLEIVGKMYLGKAGLEREAAALLLSRLYMRKDTQYAFPAFVHSFRTQIRAHGIDVITAIGYLQVINEVVKSGASDQVHDLVPDYLEIIDYVNDAPSLVGNTILRKLWAKLMSRMAVRVLPAPKTRRRGRLLDGSSYSAAVEGAVGEYEVPEVVETLLQHLFDALQDKDTIVRWSAAKGVARIAERLPHDFVSQILGTIMDMFNIHSTAAASLYDLPAIAESTWHGATLACAEMARRSLVDSDRLPTLIKWISKALYFDLRKGSHSIGSNVRDAAAYVLWSLAKTQNVASLSPHTNDLACQLITVALFDREIHIRRAASAAFQEHVGRAGLFPHGIDVLRKTDFYAIGGKRNAFLVAAPQVAEHLEYRPYIIDHLLNVVLRHWDMGMRELGSQSLRVICELDLLKLGPSVTRRAVGLLGSFDTSDVQGGLLALSEISLAYRHRVDDPEIRERLLQETFSHLSTVNKDVLFGPRNGIVTAAACQLIGNAITLDEVEHKERSSVPNWKRIIEYGLRYRLEAVQEAAAAAYASISEREDLSDDVKRLIKDLKSTLPTVQQSLPRVLGGVDYNKCQKCLSPALSYLLEQTEASSKGVVEVRRKCYQALPQILHTLLPNLTDRLSPPMVQKMFDALLSGLNDYTIDERGDVGSWVRIACVQGLTSCISDLFAAANSVEEFEDYLPLPKYHHAVAGILKQGVERLDNVRQEVGACFARLLKVLPIKSGVHTWSLPGLPLLEEIFSKADIHPPRFPWLVGGPGGDEPPDWADGAWLFPRAVRLLNIPEYRPFVLKGFILSLGCKTESTQQPAATSMSNYAKSLPASGDNGYSLTGLVTDVLGVAKANLTSNTIVIPVLRTFTILLEADALRSLVDYSEGVESLSALLDLAIRNVGRLKSIQRIQECMKITVNLIAIQAVSSRAISHLEDFLGHPYPRVSDQIPRALDMYATTLPVFGQIRTDTAEYLYLFLQGTDALEIEEEAECVLLETEWSSENVEMAKGASSKLVGSLLASIS